jgi:hypothetical protein
MVARTVAESCNYLTIRQLSNNQPGSYSVSLVTLLKSLLIDGYVRVSLIGNYVSYVSHLLANFQASVTPVIEERTKE